MMVVRLFGAAMFTVALVAAPAKPGTVSAGPVQPGQSYVTMSLAPGGRASAAVKVANASSQPEALSVRPVAGVTAENSGDAYTSAAIGPARWLLGLPGHVVVPPRTSRIVPFRVSVPAGTSPGQYLAGVAVRWSPPQQAPGGASARIAHLVVIGVAVDVGSASGLRHGLVIKSVTSPLAGRLVVTETNTANTWAHPQGVASTAGATWPARSGTVLPGGTAYLQIAAAGLRGGTHHLTVRLRYDHGRKVATWSGNVDVPTASTDIAVGPRGHPHSLSAPRSPVRAYLASTWARVAYGIGATVAVFGASWLLLAAWRRRRRKDERGNPRWAHSARRGGGAGGG